MEKAFGKLQHPFMIKALSRVGVEGAYLSIIKAILLQETYSQHHTQWAKLKAFPLRSGIRQGCLLSPFLFNIVLEVLATAFIQEKEIKGTQIGKEEVKLSLLAEDMIVYMENAIDSTKKLLDLMNEFGKTAGYKVNTQKSKAFLYSKDEAAETEIMKKIPFEIATRKIKYFGINLTKEVKDLYLSLIHISEPTRLSLVSRMPSSA